MSTFFVPNVTLQVDGQSFEATAFTEPEFRTPMHLEPLSFSMNIYPHVPARIRKMSRRRQKAAYKAHVAKALEDQLLHFTGRRIDDALRDDFSDAVRQAITAMSPTIKIEVC